MAMPTLAVQRIQKIVECFCVKYNYQITNARQNCSFECDTQFWGHFAEFLLLCIFDYNFLTTTSKYYNICLIKRWIVIVLRIWRD